MKDKAVMVTQAWDGLGRRKESACIRVDDLSVKSWLVGGKEGHLETV